MRKISIVTTCIDDWGGSEELWGRSVPFLQEAGYEISVIKNNLNPNHPQLAKLRAGGVKLLEIFPVQNLPGRVQKTVIELISKVAIGLKLQAYKGKDFSNFIKIIKEESPSLVIISQGINFDGLDFAHQCLLLNIPYVLISQKAVDFYWPAKGDRKMMLAVMQNAKMNYFVSKHNLRLTEEQFGKRLANSQVIFNPVKLSGRPVPYPQSTEVYKLACLGRIFVLDKGQDVLIRILSEQKWRNRPVTVSFIGTGDDEVALKDMAALLNVTNVEFKGHIDDIENMWKEYHALVLPSRSEGLPLSMVEAMSAGRPVIVSNAGGNTELVNEGITGFIGHPNESSFGDAMERAWVMREQWEEIGKNAAKFISTAVPKSPETDFANLIIEMINP